MQNNHDIPIPEDTNLLHINYIIKEDDEFECLGYSETPTGDFSVVFFPIESMDELACSLAITDEYLHMGEYIESQIPELMDEILEVLNSINSAELEEFFSEYHELRELNDFSELIDLEDFSELQDLDDFGDTNDYNS